MSAPEVFTFDELARYLGIDRRKLEKLVNRGRIPGRKVGGHWQFHQNEITQWLEKEMRDYSDPELAVIEDAQASEETDPNTPVTSLLSPETVSVPLDGKTKRSVLETLVEVAGRTWQVWEPNAILKAVLEREDAMSTAFDNGVAVPHPRNPLPDALGKSLIAYGTTPRGIPFGAPNGSLSDMFFLVLARDPRTHLQVLARLSRILQMPGFVMQLRNADDSNQAYQMICAADEQLAGPTG